MSVRNFVIGAVSVYFIMGIFVVASANLVSAGSQKVMEIPAFFEPVRLILDFLI